MNENYNMTINYIQLEESTQKVNQEQIQQLDHKIKESLEHLKKMKEAYSKQENAKN